MKGHVLIVASVRKILPQKQEVARIIFLADYQSPMVLAGPKINITMLCRAPRLLCLKAYLATPPSHWLVVESFSLDAPPPMSQEANV